MFSTNIVTVNNFYKRLASVFIAIALMMMTSMWQEGGYCSQPGV